MGVARGPRRVPNVRLTIRDRNDEYNQRRPDSNLRWLAPTVNWGVGGCKRGVRGKARRTGSRGVYGRFDHAMQGIDSSSASVTFWRSTPIMDWTCEQAFYYSYAGPGDSHPHNEARTITHGAPYAREDNLGSSVELVTFMRAQVAKMAPAVVADRSQGVWCGKPDGRPSAQCCNHCARGSVSPESDFLSRMGLERLRPAREEGGFFDEGYR